MRSKLNDDPIPPRRVRPEISPELEEVVLRALERSPNDRFESAFELREALAHPESVRLTNRAARLRPQSRIPQWLRISLTVAGGIAAYVFLIWAFSVVGALIPRATPAGAAQTISGR